MKLEEKIKDKYLYSNGLNIFKFFILLFNYLKQNLNQEL